VHDFSDIKVFEFLEQVGTLRCRMLPLAVKGGSVLEALSSLVTEMSFFLYDGTDDTDVVVLIERLGALRCRTLPCFRLSRAAASLRRSCRSST